MAQSTAPPESPATPLEIKPSAGMRLRVLALILAASVQSMTLVWVMLGGGQDFFARRTTLTTYMPDAAGITTDSEVRLSGIRIGQVHRVELSGELDPRRTVRTELRVLTRYLKDIPEDSQTDVSADTLVGYPFIDIAEGRSQTPVREEGILLSEPVKQASERADLIQTLQNEFAAVDQILADVTSPDTEMGKFILGSAEYDTVLSDIRAFDGALHTFLTPQSDLGQAFYTDQLYNRIHDLVNGVDKTLASIQSGEGAAGHLFASDEQYDEMVRELKDLRASLADANNGKGAAGAMLREEAEYNRIKRLLAATDSMLLKFNAGEGRAGALLANAQMYESLNGSLKSIEEVLRDVRTHTKKYLRFKPF